jgi:hypothetical protein
MMMVFENAGVGMGFGFEVIAKGVIFKDRVAQYGEGCVHGSRKKGLREEVAHLVLRES